MELNSSIIPVAIIVFLLLVVVLIMLVLIYKKIVLMAGKTNRPSEYDDIKYIKDIKKPESEIQLDTLEEEEEDDENNESETEETN